jgi:predicted Zn-dependent protease
MRVRKTAYPFIILLFILSCSCVPTVKKMERVFTPSVESEKKMGRDFAREAEKKLTLVRDPELVEYLYRIGMPIVEAASEGRYRFRFHIVRNSTVNAFAVPGGHLYLYSGLLLKASSAGEIAAVIAHELAHVTQRHTAQMVGRGTLVNLVTLAAMIASRGERAVTVGAMGAGQALMLRFSRDFEREADRFGVFYLHRAGYDPRWLMDALEMMMKEQKFSTSDVPPYLLTHPVTSERLDNIENVIRVHNLQLQRPRQIPGFYRFQALLRIHVQDRTRVIPFFRQQVQRHPGDARRWHQLGLAYDRAGLYNAAIKALSRAIRLDSGLVLAWVDLADLQARLGNYHMASKYLNRALSMDPSCTSAHMVWGRIYLRLNKPRQAARHLTTALSIDPYLIEAHKLLARAKKQMDDEGGFHEEMASFQEKMDRTNKAISHLKRALEIYGASTPKGARIKARIEMLKSS